MCGTWFVDLNLNQANDIAILTLDAPVVLSRTVGPVCLAPASADPDQYADQSAVIMGWGLQSNERSSTDNYCDVTIRNSFLCSIVGYGTTGTVLKQGTVLISSNSDCKADTKFGKYVTDANICIASTDKFVCLVIHQLFPLNNQVRFPTSKN